MVSTHPPKYNIVYICTCHFIWVGREAGRSMKYSWLLKISNVTFCCIVQEFTEYVGYSRCLDLNYHVWFYFYVCNELFYHSLKQCIIILSFQNNDYFHLYVHIFRVVTAKVPYTYGRQEMVVILTTTVTATDTLVVSSQQALPAPPRATPSLGTARDVLPASHQLILLVLTRIRWLWVFIQTDASWILINFKMVIKMNYVVILKSTPDIYTAKFEIYSIQKLLRALG